MVLKHQQLLKTPLFGLEEDEITWFSNKQDFVRKRNKALEEE